MLPETKAIVDKLRLLLELRFGATVRVVETGDYAAAAEAGTIHVVTTHAENPYAGGHRTDRVSVTGGGLQIVFEASEHDLSGQCDVWTAEVRGAAADERAAFVDLFHPRQRQGSWSSHPRVVFTWDGVASSF